MAGRRRFEPTDEQRKQVESMAGFGIPQDDIAALIHSPSTGKPIDPKTLRKAFRVELSTGETKANVAVGQSLFRQAVGAPAVYDAQGNCIRAEQAPVVSAAIFWSKARMGWRETSVHQHEGKNGGPIQMFDAAALANMTSEELAELEATLATLDRLAQLTGRAGAGQGGAGQASG